MTTSRKTRRPRIVDLTQLGMRVRDARARQGWNQLQLAQLLGSAQGWLSELETGQHASMEVDTVRRLADTLGISTDYLLGRTDDPHQDRKEHTRVKARLDDS